MKEWFDCPPEVDLAARFESPNADYPSWRGAVALVSSTLLTREEVKAGGPVGGCVARVDLALQRLDAAVPGGRVLRLRLVEVDGRWRILGY